MSSADFDFVIVGGGLAGLVLGACLSEDSDTTVLVIEAGKDVKDDPRVDIPAMWPSLLNDPHASWQFKTVPQEGLGGREVGLTQGRLVGGSSALNGLAFSATSQENIDAWTNLGNPGWGWENFSKATAKSYHLGDTREGSGPVELTIPREDDSEWPRVWRDTLKRLGFSSTNNPFTGQVSGGLTVPDSIYPATKKRSHSGNAYLKSAVGRSNFTIWPQTSANKILFENLETDAQSDSPTAIGVEYTTSDGEVKSVRARKEVLLTAGALNSPRILELSGVGDKSRLDALGIHTIIQNSFVGENLQNHPLCFLNFEVIGDEKGFETMEKLSQGDQATVAAAMEDYKSRQTGPFSRSGSNHVAQLPFPGIKGEDGRQRLRSILQIKSPNTGNQTTDAFTAAYTSFVHSVLESPTQASACYLSAPTFSTFNPDGSRASAKVIPEDERYFTIALLLAHPLSRGSVHITSSSPSGDLAIDPRYLTHPLDIEVLAAHIQYAAETIVATDPLAAHLKPGGKRNPTVPPMGSFADLENAKKFARENVVGAAHYTGTCSMMPREMGGVVDDKLRLYGCSNLRVCDASIIPITPRTNPQATVYGVAEMAAEIIKSGL
ncbi:putative GMC oxidoreductase [Annulohypoxylon stygium]|nr:putative GMC oxidoreductase [Annulohypoxylon stygium]